MFLVPVDPDKGANLEGTTHMASYDQVDWPIYLVDYQVIFVCIFDHEILKINSASLNTEGGGNLHINQT